MTLGNLVKPVFIASILVFSIAGLGMIIQEVTAEHGVDPGITKPVVAGPNTLTFRTLSTENQTFTLTIDESKVFQQGFYTINLEELDANLDLQVKDDVTVTATATSGASIPVTLVETDVNTGSFKGILCLIDTAAPCDALLEIDEGHYNDACWD